MFKFNLSSFDSVLETELKLTKRDISFDRGIEIDGDLMLNVTLTRDTPSSVIAQVSVNGVLLDSCARCLKPIKTPVETDFVALFKRKDLMDEDDEANDVMPYENNEIDIYEYLRETMILSIPMKHVCEESCKGLCPVCGRNLNEEQCGHKVELKMNNPFSELDPEKFVRKPKEE